MTGSGSAEGPLGRLAEEFLARHRCGERPAPTEYAARHPELAEQIRELFPALLLLEDVRPGPPAAAGAAAAPRDAAAPRRLGEYQILREVGRGGMGVVYEAEQESLGRRVALKVLARGALADARHVERFQREARAAARLHHTNIVPVFAVGEEGGTHYYVMQYIEGRPLDEVIDDLRRLRDQAGPRAGAAPGGKPSAPGGSAPSADMARSLWGGRSRAAGPHGPAEAGDAGRPTQREDAPAPVPPPPGPAAEVPAAPGSSGLLSDPQRPFAKGVAHLGVQVADALEYAACQGVLHRDVKPANLLLDVWGTVWLTDFGLAKASGAADLTRSGDLLGTLHYMAPERFRGQADARSDVYALGLTLYELLALRPAFDAADQAQLVGRITAGGPPRLDQLDPRLPRDLVTVVHKAMARDPADRYQKAGALAEDLRRFLDDRGILARRAGLLEQGWRLCRRNPAGAGLVAALLALLLLASGGGVWLVQQRAEARRQEEALRAEVSTAVAQAVRLRQGLQFGEARELLGQAQRRLGADGPADLRERVNRALDDTALAQRLDGARQRASAAVEGKWDFAGAAQDYAAALEGAGLGRAGEDAGAVAARVRASAVRDEVVAALDHWASITRDGPRRAWLLAVARAADPGPERNRLRQPGLWRDRAALARRAREARVAELSPQLAAALGGALLKSGGDAVPLLRAAQARHPHDFWLNVGLGLALAEEKEWDEAIGYYRAALALRPRAASAHVNLGVALYGKGRVDEAVGHYEEALRLDPKHAPAHNNLGTALRAKGQVDEAVGHYEQALRLDPKLAMAHNNLGAILCDVKGDPDGASAHFQKAIALDPKYAKAHGGLGKALQAKGRLDEAMSHYEEAIRLDPKNAWAHNSLGNALKDKGRLDEAMSHYEAALRLDPKYAIAHYLLGNALKDKGRLDEAVRHYEEALRLDPKLAMAHNSLGNALKDKGRLDEAVRHYEEALRLDPKLAPAHVNLGLALKDKGKVDEAVGHYQQALRLDPKLAQAHHNLGAALAGKGQLDEAVRHYEQALRLDPKHAPAHYNLGNALKAKGQLDEAIRHYREALRLDPKLAEAHCNLGNALRDQGHFEGALACLKRGHELGARRPGWRYPSAQWVRDAERLVALGGKLPAILKGEARPAGAAEGAEFAGLCKLTKRYAAAARLYADAFAADPQLAEDLQAAHRYNAACCAALAAAGQGTDAPKPDAKERSRLRGQALGWLRADLALRQKQAGSAKAEDRAAAQQALRHWQQDADLAGVRGKEALSNLPAEERAGWEKLWAEVADLLRRLDAGKAATAPTGK
jgi:tetratricopeptide (TPR) repeat protein